jgi:hypothetical protein
VTLCAPCGVGVPCFRHDQPSAEYYRPKVVPLNPEALIPLPLGPTAPMKRSSRPVKRGSTGRASHGEELIGAGPIVWVERSVDTYGVVTIGRWGGWLIQIVPMIYNDRLVLTPEDNQSGYDFGWCYPKNGAAELAARVWDPRTQGEPAGFIKAVRGRPRRAGEQAQG